jgi:hypothetical protein
MANLLCSFLLGGGYDAYVVYGYAPKHITLRDQTHVPAPLNTSSSEGTSKSYKSYEDEQRAGSGDEGNPYKPIDNSVRKSVFIAAEEERKRLEGLDPFVLWVPEEKPVVAAEEDVRRVHAWVLIKAGRRSVPENLFIEATTGRSYPTGSSPYIGIEALWNHRNYWVNIQPEKKFDEVCGIFIHNTFFSSLTLLLYDYRWTSISRTNLLGNMYLSPRLLLRLADRSAWLQIRSKKTPRLVPRLPMSRD